MNYNHIPTVLNNQNVHLFCLFQLQFRLIENRLGKTAVMITRSNLYVRECGQKLDGDDDRYWTKLQGRTLRRTEHQQQKSNCGPILCAFPSIDISVLC